MTKNVLTNPKKTNPKIPFYTVSGDNEQIGKQLGTLLQERIYKTLEFYKKMFNRKEEEIFVLAEQIKQSVKLFNADYVVELESMAETINLDPLWLYALNGRSEILNKFANECTSSYFKESKLLGQNWDWAQELEELVVLVKMKQDNKPTILQMTEPGIIGKIGLNSAGLGVCLNFLHIDGYDFKNTPTHIILRSILDCATIEEAKKIVLNNSVGRTANIMVGDKYGNYFDVEFAGDEQFILDTLQIPKKAFIHTNHYLGQNLNPNREEFPSSYSRYERGLELLSQMKKHDLKEFKSLLLDQKNQKLPICRRYEKPVNDFLDTTGTICSIIMDLPALKMHITRGNPFDNPFDELVLN